MSAKPKPKPKATRKSYAPAYRHDAAHLVIDTGRPIAVVAREIGVGEALLGRWVAVERAHDDDPPPGLDLSYRQPVRLRAALVRRHVGAGDPDCSDDT